MLFLTINALPLVSSARASEPTTVVSTPSIKVALEPYTPSGKLRLYTVAGGASYWTDELPLYEGDTAKVDVFVATGADELQKLKVRLDNNLIASMDQAPWSATLPASSLTPGYHFIETWVQVSGANPKSPQFASNNFTFLVSPLTPDMATSEAVPAGQIAPIAQVKGQEQILTHGQITNVPLDTAGATLTEPQVPAPLQSAGVDQHANVSITISDNATHAALSSTSGDAIDISQPAVVSVSTPPGSSAYTFVYTIQRGDETIQSSDKSFPIDATRIRLQPRTQTEPGMLNGVAVLWVWGIDSRGNYGQPVSTSINIQNAFGG